jgi:hypothetical protein
MMVLQLAWGGPDEIMWSSKWLNAFVVWVSMNSMLNTIGMVLICGVLKKTAVFSSRISQAGTVRQTEFQADSQASSQCSPDDVEDNGNLLVAHAVVPVSCG